MGKKSWLKHIIYILLLSTLIFLKEYVTGKLEFIYKRSWGADVSYLLVITMPFIFNLFIGFFLGIDHFLRESKKTGTWKINIPKILIIGLPSLFFSLTYLFGGINNQFVQNQLLRYATLGTNFIPVFQIVLGYVFITSLNKYYASQEE
jgi:hypothetical protein